MKTIYLLILGILLPLASIAQYNVRPNAYFQDMLFYNPAAMPDIDDSNNRLLLYTQSQILSDNQSSWEKSPTVILNFLKVSEGSNSFFNLGYLNDNYSFFNRHTLNAGYGKKFKVGEKSSITFGGNVVLHTDVISWSDFQLPSTETGNSTRFSPEVDFGLQYNWKRFKLGASVKNITNRSQNLEELEIIRGQRAIVINTSYDFKLSDKFQISPYLLLYSDLGTEIDAGLFIYLFNRVNASYLLRVNELRSIATLEIKVYKGLYIGGSFDKSPLLPDNNLDIFARIFF